ncbi:unnamed protein product [Parajaminaea phylloscopi]
MMTNAEGHRRDVHLAWPGRCPLGDSEEDYAEKALRLFRAVWSDQRWDGVPWTQKFAFTTWQLDAVILPVLEQRLGYRGVNPDHLLSGVDPGTKVAKWLIGRGNARGIDRTTKAILSRGARKGTTTPGALQPSARAAQFGLLCKRSNVSPSDLRQFGSREERKALHAALRHGRVRLSDAEMGSRTMCLAHTAESFFTVAAPELLHLSTQAWPDYAVSSLTTQTIWEAAWPTPAGVLMRPFPVRTEAAVTQFVKYILWASGDAGSGETAAGAGEGGRGKGGGGGIQEGLQESTPWRVANYDDYVKVLLSRPWVAALRFSHLINPTAQRCWDLLGAVRASMPSVDKIHHIMQSAAGEFVQHEATNIQILDRHTNMAKGSVQSGLAADLYFYAVLLWNVAAPYIGSDRGPQIIDTVAGVLDSNDAPGKALAKLGVMGQEHLRRQAESFGPSAHNNDIGG